MPGRAAGTVYDGPISPRWLKATPASRFAAATYILTMVPPLDAGHGQVGLAAA